MQLLNVNRFISLPQNLTAHTESTEEGHRCEYVSIQGGGGGDP